MADLNEARLDDIHFTAECVHSVQVASCLHDALLHVEDPLVFYYF